MASNLYVPDKNYVGLLQEKLMKSKLNFPEYIEGEQSNNNFKCLCKVKTLTTEGMGRNKITAKQTAARVMLDKLETEHFFETEYPVDKTISIVSVLNNFSINERRETPVYDEKPRKEGEFVFSCTFEGYSGVGTGSSKQVAKERSADDVMKHFNLYQYLEEINKLKEIKQSRKCPVTKLYELCQAKKLDVRFNDKDRNTQLKTYKKYDVHSNDEDTQSKTPLFVLCCRVGQLNVTSAEKTSKKLAKEDAATKMLHLLTITPTSSPSEIETENMNRKNHSDDDHPKK